MSRKIETDLLIVGGGATGGGIAWDAALRGLRVLLVEMGDLATGTSGRYHGLLHSGGRYAVRDLESAKECIDENQLLRKIVPHVLEDTGGYFVFCPGDDPAYIDQWLEGCKNSGIPTQRVSIVQARQREPMLNPQIEIIYEVPDGTCDSWDLLHALQHGAEQAGAQFLTYHRAEALQVENGKITGARVVDIRTGESIDVSCQAVVNAGGPWAQQVAALANCHFNMRLSRGAMLAFNIRWVNTVINRLRKPGDGDIIVPVGTVCVTGTTSVKTEDPGDTSVEAWEVERILSETEPMTPGISRARILRSWGGVRPLYDGGGGEGRDVKRTFTLLDHAVDGAAGFYSIVGGKLTTFRLMAEKAVDAVCQQIGNTTPCKTATTVLPNHEKPAHPTLHYHELSKRLDSLEHGDNPGALICECEIVTDRQIREALASGTVQNLHDLRRDLRVGMGPCQGGFCGYRAAGVRHAVVKDTPQESIELLREFIERRFGGMKPLLWGHNLRQILLNEHIYGRILGLMPSPTSSTATQAPTKPASSAPRTSANASDRRGRVLVVGAGLSGLMAALSAQEAGAVVEVIALGQGALTLHPGWIETGDVAVLASRPDHPYAHASESLADGLALVEQVVGLHESGGWAITGLGARRSIAYGAGLTTAPIAPDARLLIVGVEGWRDFYPTLIADHLNADGFSARGITIQLPRLGGNFDNWTVDVARYLDTPAGLQHLIGQIKPQLGDASVVALPAVLGFNRDTVTQITRALGCTVVEIPTLTPSVPGMRVYHALRRRLLDQGARFTLGPRVTGLQMTDGRVTAAVAETSNLRPRIIRADAVILATGGLYSSGLDSDYLGQIAESIAGLPVNDVPPRTEWFTQPFTSGAAQPIHQVGVRTDAYMRPLAPGGEAFAANLFACGRLLGGYSPVADGCTEGVDIATGVRAGREAAQLVRETQAVVS
ncbi:MAG: anaerobic glycerol-3-phosphate dehydrogenase subunit A [Anaerolineae bacterium]|nr:anaerobic glycerol-3-phosphate dehydrogenase subunit A [Anaerolineae bacterium]